MKYPIISTRDLRLLPDVSTLERITRSMSVLCEILHYPITDFPADYYFNAKWAEGRTAAHMDNTQGDLWHILFTPHGAVMLGFFHEAEMSPYKQGKIWPNMYKDLPAEFKEIFDEPAFEAREAVTFCIWRKHSDPVWSKGTVKFPFRKGDNSGLVVFNESENIFCDYLDGSAQALSMLDGNPRRFWEWANDYYADVDRPDELPLDVIEAIYAHQPLTQAMAEALNPGLKLQSIWASLLETGYPLASHQV